MIEQNKRYSRGEIYYVRSFPTVGHEQRSGRPAVIVSNDNINLNSGVVEVCYLTLREKANLPTHVFIDRGPCINSTILCEQITSVSVEKLGDFMCRLPEHLEESLNKALRVSLGLNIDKELPTQVDDSMSESKDALIKSLRYEVERLSEDLAVTKDAHEVVKEKSASALKDVQTANARADMYERMYNDLLDRLVRKN